MAEPQTLERRLAAYLAAATERGPFDWATHNCCTFAARWVREVEGLDAMPLVPTPDAAAAWRLIASYGGLAEAITEQLGRASIAPAAARLGDVVMMSLTGAAGPGARYSVGICNGRVSMFLDEAGVSHALPTVQAVCAWALDRECGQ